MLIISARIFQGKNFNIPRFSTKGDVTGKDLVLAPEISGVDALQPADQDEFATIKQVGANDRGLDDVMVGCRLDDRVDERLNDATEPLTDCDVGQFHQSEVTIGSGKEGDAQRFT
jgi:hypothetical protein